ncbi:hypothetical protein B5M42_017845 [Paenibacillus athensensis]|uniref:Uncharacterized protein n=1 Tax=Paenibacillus athensensis TaxID=1967502 RepID=A0A4Y8Q191_9BACL|nr:YqhR family membrane protein [Paenibacillus athensensis]MCD1260667.1 hypothetical protein [Paenibacillus athensensis]
MNATTAKPMKTNRLLFALYIGFFAGLIWGALKIVEHYLKFTDIVVGLFVEPFYRHDYLSNWQGVLIGWAAFIGFSVVAAFLYAVTMWKLPGPWWGLGYGAFWWAVIYLFVGPLAGMVYWINAYDWNTILTDGCLFLLWGMFIGYSIAVEYTDERSREPIHNT